MSTMLLSSSILIGAVIVLRALFGCKLSARVRYALWLVVLVRLLVPMQFGHSRISVENVIERMPQAQQATVIVVEERPPIVQETASQSSDVQLLRTVWQVGACLMGGWFLVTNLHFYRKVRKKAEHLQLSQCTLRVYVSEAVLTPCLLGFRIFLTPQVAADEDKRKHVLAHEMTHFYHGDMLWSIFRCVLVCVYWFHPLVWCAAILSKRDCELACDEGAIRRLGEQERYDYGKTLLSVAAQASKKPMLLHTATTMSQSKKDLKQRIERIASRRKRPVIVALLVVSLLSTMAVSAFAGGIEKKAERPQTVSQTYFADPTQEVTLTTTQPASTEPPTTTQTPATEPPTIERTEPQTTQPTETAPIVTQPLYPRLEHGAFLGEYTMQVGQTMSICICLDRTTKLRMDNTLPIYAQLMPMYIQDYFAPQDYQLYIQARKEGVVELYFSDIAGEYLAARIYVKTGEGTAQVGGTDCEPPTIHLPGIFQP